VVQAFLRWSRIHLLRQDAYTRLALILAGAFGAYSLGANNIANVMGVFVPVSPFTDFNVADLFAFTSAQQLFLLGAVAIGVGVFTYSKKVMLTVGSEITRLSPVAAWVVVITHSIVLFLFASEGLEQLLARAGLPTIPLVPVSSSQAVVGALLGIGLLKGGRGIRWRLGGGVGAGWVATPIISATVCFVALFFLQNVFNQQVYRDVRYALSPTVMDRLVETGISAQDFADLEGKEFRSSVSFRDALSERSDLTGFQVSKALYYAELARVTFDPLKVDALEADWLSEGQVAAIRRLSGRTFRHKWAVAEALARESDEWRLLEETKVNKIYNKEIRRKLEFVYRAFGVND
jgi:PiT family inorganic phosphate transporter